MAPALHDSLAPHDEEPGTKNEERFLLIAAAAAVVISVLLLPRGGAPS